MSQSPKSAEQGPDEHELEHEQSRAMTASATSSSFSQSHLPPTSQLSSPPPTLRDSTARDEDEASCRPISSSEPTTTAELQAALRQARMTAAHFRLQYQMTQIETTEVIERMAVEVNMSERELEVLQRIELERQRLAVASDFRLVHVDLYNAMTRDIDNLRAHNQELVALLREHTHTHSRQEAEIATLSDRVSLMRDRIQESTFSKSADRLAPSPLQSPTARRFKALSSRLSPSQRQRQHQKQAQPGFDALLMAAATTPATTSLLPSTPATKSKPKAAHVTPHTVHHVQAPSTAPNPRKRPWDSIDTRKDSTESDGTISATDDSEAETEVAGQDSEPNAKRFALQSATRHDSENNKPGRDKVQSKIYGLVRKHQPRAQSRPAAVKTLRDEQ